MTEDWQLLLLVLSLFSAGFLFGWIFGYLYGYGEGYDKSKKFEKFKQRLKNCPPWWIGK